MKGELLLAAFAERNRSAMFLTELAIALKLSQTQVERAVDDLCGRGSLIVTSHSFPDPHLAGVDLRIAAVVPRDVSVAEGEALAQYAAELVWEDWLREFLASHRCQ